MLDSNSNFFETARSLFYKLCFLVGLGTVSYQAFGTVQHWLRHESAPVAQRNSQESSVLQQKLESLNQSENDHVAQVETHKTRLHRHPRLSTKPILLGPAPPPVVGPDGMPIVAAASPAASPSGSPGEAPKAAEASPSASPSPGENIPYAEPMILGPQVSSQDPQNSQTVPTSVNSNAIAPDPNAASASGVMTNGSETNPYHPSQSYVSGYGNAASPSALTNPSNNLTQQDLNWLAVPIQAAFASQNAQVTGTLCNQSSGSACIRNNNITVNTSRWDIGTGLESAAAFSVSSTNGSFLVHATFTLQDANLNPQPISLSLKPTRIHAHNETRSGVQYRALDFYFDEQKLANGQTLSQVQAVLVYQIGTNQSGVLSSADSGFTFARKSVTTVATAWDPASATRAPAQDSTPYIVADELQFTMSLQKSP